MFNRKSNYALNKKDASAIVYIDAYESIIRLTCEDFSSEEEFQKWKSWSDAEYHISEKRDHVHSNHTLALDELSEEAASVPAVDVCMELEHDRLEQIRHSAELVAQIKKCLRATQFRRLWMYEVEKKSLEEIARLEGVSAPAVFYSIRLAHKKTQKNFLAGSKNT